MDPGSSNSCCSRISGLFIQKVYCEARESGETIYRPAPKEGKWVCAQLCQTLCDPMDCSPPGSSVMRFPRQKYWSELPFPTPGDLPDPGIKPVSPASQVDSSPLSYGGSPYEGKCLWKNFATGKLNFMEINSVQGQLYNSEKPEIPIFMCQSLPCLL